MRDRPILFSAQMIRALLDGRKTQTRRLVSLKQMHPVMKTTPHTINLHHGDLICRWNSGVRFDVKSPYAPGDRLWVREQCATWEGRVNDVVYRATEPDQGWADLVHDQKHGAPWKRRTSIHMPRWASRLTLIVTDVRVQRLQEIGLIDARAEGAPHWWRQQPEDQREPTMTAIGMFRTLWNTLHGPDAWAANPWVVALTFDVHRCNIDQMGNPA